MPTLHDLRAVPLAALVFLSACGGGGGSSEPPTVQFPAVRPAAASGGADLTLDNASATSASVLRGLLGALVGGAAVPTGSGGGGSVAVAPRATGAVVAWLARASLAPAGREQVQAVIPVRPGDFPCVSGSVSGTINDADNNNRLSSGDSANLTFASCVVFNGLPAVTGTIAIRFDLVEVDDGEPRGMVVSANLSNFGAVGLPSLTGVMSAWTRAADNGDVRTFVRYEQVSGAWNGATWVVDFDVDDTELTSGSSGSNITGRIGIGGAYYAVVPVQTLQFGPNDDHPTSGSLRIVDVNGDVVLVTAVGTQVQRSYTPSGGSATSLGSDPWSTFGL